MKIVYGQSEGKIGESLKSFELGEKTGMREVVELLMESIDGKTYWMPTRVLQAKLKEWGLGQPVEQKEERA